MKHPTGEMVEWSITAVLKTAVPRGTGGSNPSLSAKKGILLGFLFFAPFEGSHPLRKVISFRISASAFSDMPATVDGLLRNKSQIPLSPQKRNPIRVPLFLLPSRGSHPLRLLKVLVPSQNSSSHGDGHAESYHSLRKAHSSSLIVHSPSPRLRLEAYTLSNRGRSLRIVI